MYNPQINIDKILYLAKHKKIQELDDLIRKGIFINVSTNVFNNPISLAAQQNDSETVNFLISYNANIDYAILGAAYGNHSILLYKLLENHKDNIDYAIYGAARGGNVKLMQELLKKDNSAINIAISGFAYKDYNIALLKKLLKINSLCVGEIIHIAAYGGHAKLVFKLLEKFKANINTALHGAASGGQITLVYQLLERQDANINDAINGIAMTGNPALLYKLLEKPGVFNEEAVKEAISGAASGGHMELLCELLKKYKSIYKSIIDIASHDVAYEGNSSLLYNLLKQYNCSINRAIQGAIFGHHDAIAFELLKKNENEISNVLYSIIYEQRLNLLSNLLSKTRVNIRDVIYWLAYFHNENNAKLLYRLLEKYGYEYSDNYVIQGAIQGNQYALLNELLKKIKIDINEIIKMALNFEKLDFAYKLIKRSDIYDSIKFKALLLAVKHSRNDIVTYLLKSNRSFLDNININIILDEAVKTNFMIAMHLSKYDEFKCVDVLIRDNMLKTALQDNDFDMAFKILENFYEKCRIKYPNLTYYKNGIALVKYAQYIITKYKNCDINNDNLNLEDMYFNINRCQIKTGNCVTKIPTSIIKMFSMYANKPLTFSKITINKVSSQCQNKMVFNLSGKYIKCL